MHVTVVEEVSHEGGALIDCDVGAQADEVVVHDVQGVNGRALTNLCSLFTRCMHTGGLEPEHTLHWWDLLCQATIRRASQPVHVVLGAIQKQGSMVFGQEQSGRQFAAQQQLLQRCEEGEHARTMARSQVSSSPVPRRWSAHTALVTPTILFTCMAACTPLVQGTAG